MSSLELVLITGMSGSGKSVALRALEDAGYYCVDNLPPELLLPFVNLEKKAGTQRVAIAMDVRSAASLPGVPAQLSELAGQGVAMRSLFLDSTTDTLVRRFSETRRRHPLSGRLRGDAEPTGLQHALVESIELERELLGELRERAHVIDTSVIRPSQLQAHVKSLLSAPSNQVTLVFESFAFKRGIPVDADYVFDVRMLPNPHYEAELRMEAAFRCWLHTIDLQNCPNTLPMDAALRGMADAWDWLHGPYQWWSWPVLSTCNQCSPDHVCANCHSMLRYCYLSDEWWNH